MQQVKAARAAIDTIRFLAVDMVEAAGSGHPGAPMAQAPLAYQLWTQHLRFDPTAPEWLNRDRFVLSCGHASALLYALLHLAGYGLSLDELRAFRQLGSKTPGHPERGHTAGVETTTGPLGQGLGNAVGIALAEQMLGDRFNREGFPLFDYRTWVVASDGDIMEGVASEASSFAGHQALGKLNVFYDANEITIDGKTSLTFSEDVVARYRAYGWHTLVVDDGNDLEALGSATEAAIAEVARPSLILVRTHIGFGSPNKQDTSGAHGEALGGDEVKATKENLGWPLQPEFLVPDEARIPFAEAASRGKSLRSQWEEMWTFYQGAHPELAAELERRRGAQLPQGWRSQIRQPGSNDPPVATRAASGAVLNAVAGAIPELVGGSADLTGSNNTLIKGSPDFSAQARSGRNLRFGIREHGMGAILNGMALSGLLRPYGGTFLIFSDYMRPSIRLAALMGLPVIYVFTHDSVLLGEDGPTHQPISQLVSLRSIPGLTVLRPADANETVAAWQAALDNISGPTALVLTRQKIPVLAGTGDGAAERGVPQGGYVVAEAAADPEVTLIATGSELHIAIQAQALLEADGVQARVVSLPSWELFGKQRSEYREQVLLPGECPRVAIEAASPMGWERWVGDNGQIIAQEGFGASAPTADLAEHFGFTGESVAEKVRARLGK